MSLRWKVTILLSVMSALFAGTTYLVQRWVVLPGFIEAEHAEAQDDLTRGIEAIRRDCEHLAGLAHDWSAWDDTYQYVEDQNAGFRAENLIPTTFTINKLNLLAILKTTGEIVWAEVRDFKAQQVIDAPELLKTISEPNQPMVAHAAPESGVSGLMMTQLGPMLISSQAIVTSENQGPVRGALMMGRLLDAEAIAELAARTRVNLKLWPIGSKEISAHDHKALAKVTSPGSTWICDEEAEYLHGYTVLRDIFEKPVILLRADLPRLIRQRGIVAAHVATASSIAGGFGILAMMWLVLRYTVINPLTAVTRHAVRVGTVGDLSVRLNMPRKDEIGILAGEFDQMVGHLAESRAQMLTVARRAGMAEVATDVLHNVGNVLNSVNVAANLVTEKLRQSEVPGLDLAAKMMIEHQQDLGRFVTEDERGKQLPNYFAELAKFLAEEQGVMLGEMKSLTASIEHIKQVINLQQAHSKTVALVENVDPVDVLEEAIRLNLDSFGRHHVKILRGFQPIGPVPLDRHKVLQTLVNLISNAKNAIKAGDNADRQILLKLERVRAENGDRLHVSVTDNGIGITPENLSKIFSFGFSSRPGGHGFGLHSAANMAREMAGNLTASSEGPGKGETFTIEVPISHHEVLR